MEIIFVLKVVDNEYYAIKISDLFIIFATFN